jgi:hypothetical protein
MSKRILDLSDKVHMKIDGNLIPSLLLNLCKVEVCPSAKHSLEAPELGGLAEAIIEKTLSQILELWQSDVAFRQMVTCIFIANTQLDTLCDLRKHMN